MDTFVNRISIRLRPYPCCGGNDDLLSPLSYFSVFARLTGQDESGFSDFGSTRHPSASANRARSESMALVKGIVLPAVAVPRPAGRQASFYEQRQNQPQNPWRAPHRQTAKSRRRFFKEQKSWVRLSVFDGFSSFSLDRLSVNVRQRDLSLR